MNSSVEYETPENVKLSYQIAGPGSRFIAWFLDQLLLYFLMILLFIGIILFSAISEVALDDNVRRQVDSFLEGSPVPRVAAILFGLMILLWGLGSFVYYSLCELFMQGQTPGKRATHIRVIKENGFSLDGSGIVLRNLFRVVDQMPILWVVPLLNSKFQRFGDMVGGTLVVEVENTKMNPLRHHILEIPAHEIQFRFTSAALNKLTPQQLTGIEQICERWGSLDETSRAGILQKIMPSLVQRLNMELPDPSKQYQFLTDLLHAEYRRQERMLG